MLNKAMTRGVERNLSRGYALCSCDPESERQNVGSRNRLGAVGDFDCGGFPAVSQIITTV